MQKGKKNTSFNQKNTSFNQLIVLLAFVPAFLSAGVIGARVRFTNIDGSAQSRFQYEFQEYFVKQYKATAGKLNLLVKEMRMLQRGVLIRKYVKQ